MLRYLSESASPSITGMGMLTPTSTEDTGRAKRKQAEVFTEISLLSICCGISLTRRDTFTLETDAVR